MEKITVKKFGGKSTGKSLDILHSELIKSTGNVVVVNSAFGKSTQNIVDMMKSDNKNKNFNNFMNYYGKYIERHDLTKDQTHEIVSFLEKMHDKIHFVEENKTIHYRDELLSFGERISTKIVYYYLCKQFGPNNVGYLPATKYISTFQNSIDGAEVNFPETEKRLAFAMNDVLEKRFTVTEGYIGSNQKIITTLGWNGSDYTGAIMAKNFGAVLDLYKDTTLHFQDPKKYPKSKRISTIDWGSYRAIFPQGNDLIFHKVAALLEHVKNSPVIINDINTGERTLIHSIDIDQELFDSLGFQRSIYA